jgi:hypothetical protein
LCIAVDSLVDVEAKLHDFFEYAPSATRKTVASCYAACGQILHNARQVVHTGKKMPYIRLPAIIAK